MIADVVDHAFVVPADGVPAAADHGGPFARAEPAIHGADVRRHHQAAVGIAVRDARHRRILVLFERIVEFKRRRRLQRGGHRLQTDGIVGIRRIDEREVVRRNGEFVLGLESTDGFEFFGRERQKLTKLPDGANGVLRLPPPIVPHLVGDIAPERMTLRFTGRLFVVDAVILHR